jgi:AraC-like DNA-binding protein
MSSNISMKSKSGSPIDLPATDGSLKRKSREISLELPEALGKGSFREIRLHSGIRLGVLDYESREPVIEYEGNAPVFGFGFCLSGNIKSRVSCLKDSLVIKSGQSGFFHFPDLSGLSEEVKGHIIRVLIQMEPDLFYSFMEDDFDHIPLALRKFAERTEKKAFRVADIITPSMQTSLHQILSCPYHGLTRQLFLESKAMELMAYKLEQFESEPAKTKIHPVLKSNDVERIHYARDLLIRDIENPPDLVELARMAGLSRSKLHHNFCAVYGITPFDYLRNRRLEKARISLNEGNMDVTEISYSVGYSSLSHFARVFKQYFGMPPSNYRRNNFSLQTSRTYFQAKKNQK